MHFLSRRDFLKFSALLPAGLALSPWLSKLNSPQENNQKNPVTNMIVIVFDAMTARNLSVYGYPRKNTPNLIRFANRANVYHSHDSAGNFTIPGTTSLLTGLYPWTHRAINEAGLMARGITDRNIFKSSADKYNRLVFAQNIWANFIVSQFDSYINARLSPQSFSAASGIVGNWFKNDSSFAYRSFDEFLFKFDKFSDNKASASLLFGTIERFYFLRQVAQSQNAYTKQYPIGLPFTENYPIYYRLEDVFDGVISSIKNIKEPTFAYFHFYPPHEPFNPSKQFYRMFADSYSPVTKDPHPLGPAKPQIQLNDNRRRYDEYIADLDSQFGRLLDALQESGFLDNSIVAVTSDHGQLFERGVVGHVTPLLYDPVLHIPLLISLPGQTTRNDIYDPTNSVDVLPTLLHLSGLPIPNWCEGTLLPGLGGIYDPQRSTFSIEAKLNPAFAPLKIATIAMRKGNYKLIHYIGYHGNYSDAYELYNLENDIEEMHDLYTKETIIASQMKAELLDALNKANAPFKG